MSKSSGKDADETRGYASPPCYQHELDPNYLGTVPEWRKQTRARLIALRASVTDDERNRRVDAIVKNLEAADVLGGHQRIGFYWPMTGEIDLRPLLTRLTDEGIKAALPVITQAKQPLEFWAWGPGDKLDNSGLWGIPVPVTRDLVDVSALLIPLVGFDAQGHRLGHGGGYYDRTLASMEPRPFTIGIGFESGRLPSIYPQPHDIPLDVIVTDTAAYGG